MRPVTSRLMLGLGSRRLEDSRLLGRIPPNNTGPGPPMQAQPTEKYLRSNIQEEEEASLSFCPLLIPSPRFPLFVHFPPAHPHRRRAMPPPVGLPPWPTPSTTRLATPTPTRPPPRTTHVRPPPPPPYTRVRLPPPPPATTPPPRRLEPAAPKPAAVSTPVPPATVSAASSSSTCLDCVHFGKCVSRSADTRTQREFSCLRVIELIFC